MEESEELKIPLRKDGTPKVFWHEPGTGLHICHRDEDGYVSIICVGHHD